MTTNISNIYIDRQTILPEYIKFACIESVSFQKLFFFFFTNVFLFLTNSRATVSKFASDNLTTKISTHISFNRTNLSSPSCPSLRINRLHRLTLLEMPDEVHVSAHVSTPRQNAGQTCDQVTGI